MSIECEPQHTAYKSSLGVNIAVIDDNYNAARLAVGYLGGIPQFPGVSSVNAAVYASVDSLLSCIQLLHTQGWKVVVGDGVSSGSGTTEDTIIKDVAGPVYRQYLAGAADAFWEMEGDARLGADGAASSGDTATTCAGGATYLGDHIHPTACMQQALGAQLTNVIEAMLSKPTPPIHVASASSYSMTGLDVYATLEINGSAAAITAPPCAGAGKRSLDNDQQHQRRQPDSHGRYRDQWRRAGHDQRWHVRHAVCRHKVFVPGAIRWRCGWWMSVGHQVKVQRPGSGSTGHWAGRARKWSFSVSTPFTARRSTVPVKCVHGLWLADITLTLARRQA